MKRQLTLTLAVTAVSAMMMAAPRPFRQLVPTRTKTVAAHSVPGFHTAVAQPAPGEAARARKSRARYSGMAELRKDIELRGCVVASASFSYVPGLYTVPTTAGGSFEMVAPDVMADYGGWNDGSGKYYAASVMDWGMGFVSPELYVYDTNTWEQIDYIQGEYSILATDCAEDPTTGSVYGCYYDDNYEFLTWAKADYPSGLSQPIRTLGDGEKMFGVACDATGQYYAVLEDGSFVKVDKATGEFTLVGDTGLRPYYVSSAVFDAKSGTFIFSYAPVTGTSSLWAIDLATGSASLLVDFPDCDEVTVLEVVSPAAEPLAPAAPSITASAPQGSMTVSYEIAMPSTLFNGDTPDGFLTWTLMLDGEKIDGGESAFGATLYGSTEVATKGVHTLVAYAENEAGKGPSAKIDVVVGSGVPLAPDGFTAHTDGSGYVWLNWEPVTGSADGGYIDPAGVTYTLTRDGKVLAEGMTDTYFDETVDIPDTYTMLSYGIQACYADATSQEVLAKIGVGSITPPYSSSFSSEPYDDGLYTVVNANNDAVEWYFSPYYGCFKYDYDTSNPGDDWLFTPAFHLEAGKIYEFSFSIAAGHTMYKERYAVAMGAAATPAAMTTELIPPTDLVGDLSTAEIKTLTVKPDKTGSYYFGWHAMSDASMFMIQVKDIRVSAPMAATSPTEPTDIELTPDADGHLTLTGRFNAPATDISGAAAGTLGKVVVGREDKDAPVAEFNGVEAAAALTFSDNDIPAFGTYTYTFTAWDADGNIGRVARKSVYVGPVAPENVPAVRVVETSVPGEVTVSWDAPAADIDGRPLKDENLTYMVYVADGDNVAQELLEEPIASREAKFTVCATDEQAFALFYVKVFNLGFESLGFTRSDMVPVGKPAEIPYSHSFNADDRAANMLGYVMPEGSFGEVSVGNMQDDKVAAQDGDDAFLKVYCPMQYVSPEFFTGKIALPAGSEAWMSIYHYVWSEGDTNTFDILAVTADGKNHLLATVDHADGSCHEGWNYVRVPLADFAGANVKLIVRPFFISHQDMLFDNMRVQQLPAVDLAATALSVPARVELVKEFKLTATVVNLGRNDCAGFTAGLYCNGELVDEVHSVALAAGNETSVEFTQTLSPLTTASPEYFVKVTADGDEVADNDATPAAVPVLNLPEYPSVSDLIAVHGDGSEVVLTWTAPSTDGFDAKPVEDFSDAPAWTEDVAGWTMIDRDGQQIGSLDGAAMPDAVAMRTRHSFFVFDGEDEEIFFYNPELVNLVKGSSGSKCLVAMYILPYDKNQDDWAISPELSGEAQAISFEARSYHPDYLDHMEVLYSMSNSTDPDDFITLCPDGEIEVPQLVDAIGNAAYKHYEFNLPAGAKRFAIRAVNPGGEGFMLMIDDVKFEIANAVLAIDHYDVYRDGVRINDAPVMQPAYTDMVEDGGSHDYRVIVNYNRGISAASNTATILALGIDDASLASLRVAVEGSDIVVCGCAGAEVRIHSVDGRAVYRGHGDVRVSVAPGAYLVTASGVSRKVLVK